MLDLRTLAPLDREASWTSVKKTGKALIVHEDNLTGGLGGEIAAIIAARGLRVPGWPHHPPGRPRRARHAVQPSVAGFLYAQRRRRSRSLPES